jgi:uncharacterized membrane protein YjgN (DUF898 family)
MGQPHGTPAATHEGGRLMGGKLIGAVILVIAVLLGVTLLFSALHALMGVLIFAVLAVALFLLASKMLRHSRR